LELLPADAVTDKPVLVSPDGRIIARQRDDAVLEYAWVNRVRGAIHSHAKPLLLSPLGGGKILAICRSRPSGLLLLWTHDSATSLCRVDASGQLSVLSSWPWESALGVLHGHRAVLTVGGHRGTIRGAFEDLSIEALRSVSSGGRTIVIATGRNRDDVEAHWAEMDGIHQWELHGNDISVVLPASDRQPPELVVDGQATVPERLTVAPDGAFRHWEDHASASAERDA